MLGWVRKRVNHGRGEVARHQTLSRLGERCCWEISRWEETNWKFVGAGMYILGSVLSGLTWWQSFWEEEQMVLRQGRGKQFWENSNEQSVDERRQEMRSAGRRDIMSYRWRGQTGLNDMTGTCQGRILDQRCARLCSDALEAGWQGSEHWKSYQHGFL